MTDRAKMCIMVSKEGCDMSLKDNWKSTGTGLGHAFKDLGKTLVKTASTAANKVDQWANGDEEKPAEEAKEEQK